MFSKFIFLDLKSSQEVQVSRKGMNSRHHLKQFISHILFFVLSDLKFDPKEAEHESLMGKIQQHRGEALTKKQRKWIENGEIDPLKPTHPAGVLALLLK